MANPTETLDPVTILIEWENAIDVEDEWTFRAMRALEAEIARVYGRMTTPPEIVYLYDETAVDERVIRDTLDKVAPQLGKLARVRLVPTPGLTYYQLKNYGAQQVTTDIVMLLDSDAGPQEGWLEGLLKPFDEPEIMVTAGSTVLGHEDFLSRTMALVWIFDLPSEAESTARQRGLHANNCAFRTAFFQANPFPDLPTFKKQCGFWLRDVRARGYRFVRTAEAIVVHAPHPGLRYVIWRAWTAGLDRDFQTYHSVATSRFGRVGRAFRFAAKKCARSLRRIVTRHREVDLPVWQTPFAVLAAWGYYGILFVGQIAAASTRSYGPLEMRKEAPGENARGADRAEISADTI